jgi:hypothetical protein
MPMIAQGVSPPVLFSDRRKLWVSPFATAGAHGDSFAPLSPPILFSVGKSCGRFAWRPRTARGERSHMPLSFIASWLPSFLILARQQVYRPNRSNMPQPSSQG